MALGSTTRLYAAKRRAGYKPTNIPKPFPSRYDGGTTRHSQMMQIRAAQRIAPGLVQVGGAYGRSIPFGGELKYADSGLGASGTTAVTAASTGTIVTMYDISNSVGGPSASWLLIPQGTTKNTRIGNKIRVTCIRIKYTINLPSSAQGDYIRVILYLDKQANGATAAVANILEQAGVQSFQAMDYVDRIKIIKDKMHKLNACIGTTAASSTPYVINGKMSHKMNLEVHYSSTTGALTEIQSNNLGLLIISQAGIAQITATGRVYFYDK